MGVTCSDGGLTVSVAVWVRVPTPVSAVIVVGPYVGVTIIVSACRPRWFRLSAGILKTPCVAHRIDQPSPNFGQSAERPSLTGVTIFWLAP
jgi:hypothetical protein